MVAGLINSAAVLNAHPTRATIQVGLFPVADDPHRRIRELEEMLAKSEAAWDKLCEEKQLAERTISELTHQINQLAHQISYMRETYVPRSVVEVLNPLAVVVTRR